MIISVIILILGVYAVLQFVTKPITVQPFTVIYIKADGSLDPSNASILTVESNRYVFTADIYGSIVIERDNIIVDGADYVLQGRSETSSRGIDLSGRNNVTITNVGLEKFGFGIYLSSASNNVLSQNNLANNNFGIEIMSSSNNTLYENNITSGVGAIGISQSSGNNVTQNNLTGTQYSISLENSSGNSISENSITNSDGAIGFSQSSGNNITENHLKANGYGMYITYSTNNIIFHNNFGNNNYQIYSSESQSVWDDGYPNGGNYWSDFQNLYPDAKELDSSGIWDTPYTISDNNKDNYPLVNA